MSDSPVTDAGNKAKVDLSVICVTCLRRHLDPRRHAACFAAVVIRVRRVRAHRARPPFWSVPYLFVPGVRMIKFCGHVTRLVGEPLIGGNRAGVWSIIPIRIPSAADILAALHGLARPATEGAASRGEGSASAMRCLCVVDMRLARHRQCNHGGIDGAL